MSYHHLSGEITYYLTHSQFDSGEVSGSAFIPPRARADMLSRLPPGWQVPPHMLPPLLHSFLQSRGHFGRAHGHQGIGGVSRPQAPTAAVSRVQVWAAGWVGTHGSSFRVDGEEGPTLDVSQSSVGREDGMGVMRGAPIATNIDQ